MTKAEIHPGRCEHVAKVRVQMLENDLCSVELESECHQMQLLASRVAVVNPDDEINQGSSRILAQACRCCHHTSCPIPVALIRAVEIESGMDLSGDIDMHFERA
ncbi:DUF6951 family protein [Verrucomicrobiota bacterium]